MMNKFIFVFIIIFSLITGYGVESKPNTINNSFIKLEQYLLDKTDFVQNGVKIEYSTSLSPQEERERIISVLKNEFNGTLQSTTENLFFKGEMGDMTVTIYESETTRVEITIINTDISERISNLTTVVEKIKDKNLMEQRYFSFYMVKLRETVSNVKDYVKSQLNKDSIDSIQISNGEVLKGTLEDGEKVNLGIINYDTGDYLIIGTPIIFVTY